ncbi:hypothetical protein J25TS5_49160 [Paenibacillus faecis]|uniref:ABC transporter permease n=1 Tax=Paenibacillus faecis TaxID=862114 RepID=UPI001B02396A|nr:FtsX-like permease family protein [Paenibacillus faecis]GIO87984.1 hypothetical protein J25TS5_49160 [Paenibacillus faecis]
MRTVDVLRMAWGQIIRRKVVTLLCMAGLAIGCAALIIALNVGKSVQTHTEKTLNENYRMDEITVSPNEGISSGGGGRKTGASSSGFDRGALTPRKLEVIRNLPHVVSVAPMLKLDYMEMVTSDGRSSGVEVIGTELASLRDFGFRFAQGAPSEMNGAAVVNYGATYGLVDPKVIQQMQEKLSEDPYNDELLQQFMELMSAPADLYQNQIQFKSPDPADMTKMRTSTSLRVMGVLKLQEGTNANNAMYDKKVYVSLDTARMLKDQLQSGETDSAGSGRLNSALVKVEDKKYVAQVEQQIQRLTLRTESNLFQEKAMSEQLDLYRKAAMGIGLFVMMLASLSIIVAMIMSTHQRRKQIGVMKVLGANLWQIREMFIVEAALLGLLGGTVGIVIAFLAVDQVNALLASQMMSREGGPMTVAIELSTLPAGMVFAVVVGVLAGIYPAISASRTNALRVIKSA